MAHPAPQTALVELRPLAPAADYALLLEKVLDDCQDEPQAYARRTSVEAGAE